MSKLQKDHYPDNILERIRQLEQQVKELQQKVNQLEQA